MNDDFQYQTTWSHPSVKLREPGPKAVSTKELLAILISTRHKGKSAEKITGYIMQKFDIQNSAFDIRYFTLVWEQKSMKTERYELKICELPIP